MVRVDPGDDVSGIDELHDALMWGDNPDGKAELDALLAENQRLREDRDRWREYCEAETLALDSAKVENQRLREALERIAALITTQEWVSEDDARILVYAREALAGDAE